MGATSEGEEGGSDGLGDPSPSATGGSGTAGGLGESGTPSGRDDAGDDDAAMATTGSMPGDGTEGAEDSTGGGLPVLLDRGLLVRYFLDEAASGVEPLFAKDAAPEPLDLEILYDDDLTYAEVEGHRGLAWTDSDSEDRLMTSVGSTKLQQGLDGRNGATLELVMDLSQIMSTGSRFIEIASGSNLDLLLATRDVARIGFVMNDTQRYVEWEVDLTHRVVLHMVYDTTQPDAEDRIMLYADGIPAPRIGSAVFPDQGQPLSIGAASDFVIGNHRSGNRAFIGRIFYAAIYGAPLTADEVAVNAALLQVDDDTPR